MQGKQIAIVFIAGIVAFGAAFGVGKATSKSDAAGSSSASLEAVTVAGAPAVGTAQSGGALPALKSAPKKVVHHKKAPKPTVTPSGTARPVPTQAAPVPTQVRPVPTQAVPVPTRKPPPVPTTV